MAWPEITKYPRTPHLEGSRLQKGDDASGQVPYNVLRGCYIVVEEKLDGGNGGIGFSEDLDLQLQSRGHYLTGGPREKHFNLLKTWAAAHQERLAEMLWDQYLCYGEYMYAKHSIFYDSLPHIFCEFDIYDRATGRFLSTAARRRLIGDAPVLSVPVLYAGPAPDSLDELLTLIRPSLARTTGWREALRRVALQLRLDPEQVLAECDPAELSEGLYIKVEEGEETVGRYKWVRSSFVQTIVDGGVHWLERPVIPNQLHPKVDIFAPQLTTTWADMAPFGGIHE